MDLDTFVPSNVIHRVIMKIDLDLSVGDPGGAAAPDDDEVGKFSDGGLFDMLDGDDDEEPIVIASHRWHFLYCACVLKGGGYESLGGTDLSGAGL